MMFIEFPSGTHTLHWTTIIMGILVRLRDNRQQHGGEREWAEESGCFVWAKNKKLHKQKEESEWKRIFFANRELKFCSPHEREKTFKQTTKLIKRRLNNANYGEGTWSCDVEIRIVMQLIFSHSKCDVSEGGVCAVGSCKKLIKVSFPFVSSVVRRVPQCAMKECSFLRLLVAVLPRRTELCNKIVK